MPRAELLDKPRYSATESKPKVGSINDVYNEQGWKPRFPLEPREASSGVSKQPRGRIETVRGLGNRLANVAAEVMPTHPEIVVFGGENGDIDLVGRHRYDMGALGVQIFGDNPARSIAYTGTSSIPPSWAGWVDEEEGREYGDLIKGFAERQLGLDPETILKDPMGYRSGWKLEEYNRRSIYKAGFQACLAPLLNSELYQDPPDNLTREELMRRLDQVRGHVNQEQQVPREPVEQGKYLFVTGSANRIKFKGTSSALTILQERGALERIAHAHLYPNQSPRDFQLIAEPISLGVDHTLNLWKKS